MKHIFFMLLFAGAIFAQEKDPYKILKDVKAEYERIQDYSVDININVDVNFLRMPKTRAKIFYKAPNKIRMKSDGFALLPKAGLNFTPTRLLDQDYDAIYIDSETENDTLLDVIKVIPKSDSSGVILTTLKIDPVTKVIRRVQSTTKKNGTFEIDLHYNDKETYHLPSVVTFTFNVEGLSLPASMTGDLGEEAEAEEKRTGQKRNAEGMKGKVIVTYTNYKVNLNLPDEIFEEEADIPEEFLN